MYIGFEEFMKGTTSRTNLSATNITLVVAAALRM
jgi:hypothetical protein